MEHILPAMGVAGSVASILSLIITLKAFGIRTKGDDQKPTT